MAWEKEGNIRGPRGPQGRQGIPGVNGIENAEAVAAYMLDPGTPVHNAFGQLMRDAYGRVSVDAFAGADDTAKLQAAIDAAKAANDRRKIVVTRPITIERTIEWDAGFASLEFVRVPVMSTVTDGPTFHVFNSKTYLTANVVASLSGLELRGPGSANINAKAFSFSSATNTAVRGINLQDVEIRGFGVGIEVLSNAYLLRFINTHIWDYDVAVSMPYGSSNYGENIAFIGANIGSGRLGISQRNPDGDMYFTNCSFDFMEKLCETSGMVGLVNCHVEMRHTQVTGPIVTTSQGRATFLMQGGRLMMHYYDQATLSTPFETIGNSYGCGVRLIDVETFGLRGMSGFLCSGTGNIYTRGLYTMVGAGTLDTLHTSPTNNRLLDPSFGSAAGQSYASVRDFYISSAGATSRTESPSLTITQVAPGRLVITRIAAGSNNNVTVNIPVSKDLEKEWGARLTLSGGPASGSFTVTESFTVLEGVDSLSRPIVKMSDARAVSTIQLSGLTYPHSVAYGVAGDANWNRRERPWATHYRVTMDFGNVPVGSSVNFSGFVVAPR